VIPGKKKKKVRNSTTYKKRTQGQTLGVFHFPGGKNSASESHSSRKNRILLIAPETVFQNTEIILCYI
jgi:hypothetical protein